MSAATQSAMINAFKKALEKPVEGYLKQVPEIPSDIKKEMDDLEKAFQLVGSDTPAGKAIQKQLQKVTPDTSKQQKIRAGEVAAALVAACNELRVPIQVKKSKRASGASGGSGSRLTKDQMESACEAVLKVLPSKGAKTFMNGAEVMEQVKLDNDVVKKALAKLKRDEVITTNGIKGKKGGYKKA